MIEMVRANVPLHPVAVAVLDTLEKNKVAEWHIPGAVEGRADVGRQLGPLGAVLYLHGGGWTFGNLESHDLVCRRLCASTNGVVVVNRLAAEHLFPAALDDCRALERLEDEVAALNVDVNSISVAGDSTGGNLAVGLCVRARDHGGPAILAQMFLYPAIVSLWENLSYCEKAREKLVKRVDLMWFWDNYLGDTSRDNPYAAPGAPELRNLPPVLDITVGHDPLRDDGEMLGHQLSEASNAVELRRYNEVLHDLVEKADRL